MPPAKYVEHAGTNPRSRTLGAVCPPARVHEIDYREMPAVTRQSVLDC